MPSVISGDANVSATEFGYLDGVTSALQTQMDSKLPLAGGKILQIVRATDGTERTTTSTSFVDASLSVTITPQKSDSAILLWATFAHRTDSSSDANPYGTYQIADSSNNAISGAESPLAGIGNFTGTGTRRTFVPVSMLGYATPATTSAVTYKLRFASGVATTTLSLKNTTATAQLFAIEVSA